ncbi:hypothetical protein SDC9_121396 [bioreactor metagenome]|uniref:CAAX prenyl protease 2/Lysostaphin resistance protein A-like domain-containing protein n=1 Tax=bioreactor metagenome TaxID=1076179 RepID=A0A645CBZ5_9ZZZZ
MKKPNYMFLNILFVIIGCIFMTYIETIICPDYWIKSIIKAITFLGLYCIYNKIDKNSVSKPIKQNKKSIIFYFVLCICVYAIIIITFIIIQKIYDFSNITSVLETNYSIDKSNYIYVFLYISFINSFLEELFFRKFAFLTLAKHSSFKFANIFSAAAFSIYHVSIIKGWFSASLFLVIIVALFICGLFFNYIDSKNKTIYPSWLIHITANLSINTIGIWLFTLK